MSTAFRKVVNPTCYYCSSATVSEGAVMVVDTATDDYVCLPAGADPTSGIVGLAMNALTAAGRLDVAGPGDIFPAIASAAITRGDKLAVHGTTGKVKTAAPGAGTNTMVVGTALESASGDGERIACLISPYLMQGA